MIKLASPEQIRAWSYGEVKKPETIITTEPSVRKRTVCSVNVSLEPQKSGNVTAVSSSLSGIRVLFVIAAVLK